MTTTGLTTDHLQNRVWKPPRDAYTNKTKIIGKGGWGKKTSNLWQAQDYWWSTSTVIALTVDWTDEFANKQSCKLAGSLLPSSQILYIRSLLQLSRKALSDTWRHKALTDRSTNFQLLFLSSPWLSFFTSLLPTGLTWMQYVLVGASYIIQSSQVEVGTRQK